MKSASSIDIAAAHAYFSVDCFNQTWELLERAQRTPEEEDQMRSLCHASLWHWTQRPDCTPRNLSIGYWQLSRVYALLGQAEDAVRFGEKCLQHSAAEEPFYLGYAHEALARAARVRGDSQLLKQHLAHARQFASQVGDPEERAMLQKDLETLL